jgi:hypothetical protein
MDPELKSILRGLSLKLRHLLEGYYDEEGRWHPGDLERRLNELGVWRERTSKPIDEMPHLSKEDLAARKVVDAYLQYRKEAGVSLEEAVAEFVRESAYTWANRLFALRCMEARDLIDEVILQKEAYGGRSLQHRRLALKHPELCSGEDDGLFLVLFQEFKRQAEELPQLFNPHVPAMALRPSAATLKRCIALLSGSESADGEVAFDVIFKAPDAFGWAYQYWNSEEKDRVFETIRTRRRAKIEGVDIIPATCIYTEPYMVKFLVQNSLGALWVGMYPDTKLCDSWKYYVKDADRASVEKKKVSKITFLDPACGSGHFLIEAFDLFYAMYQEEGEITDPEEICASILERNLYGTDIDERAVQIATLALVMKAKEKNRNFKPRRVNLVATNIRLSAGKDHLEAFLGKHPDDSQLRPALLTIFDGLEHADELGSLLRIEEPVEKELRYFRTKLGTQTTLMGLRTDADWETWRRSVVTRLRDHLAAEEVSANLVQSFFSHSADKGLMLFDLLARSYDVVATNPPYMGSGNMGSLLKKYVQHHYAPGKFDLYAAFIIRCLELAQMKGRVAMVTQQSWMFLRSFASLRTTKEENLEKVGVRSFKGILRETTLETLVQLGPGAFGEISGEVVNIALFTLSKAQPRRGHRLTAFRLVGPKGPEEKDALLLDTMKSPYRFVQNDLLGIPESPIAYWLTSGFAKALIDGKSLADTRGSPAIVCMGSSTKEDKRFLRYFWEIPMKSSRWVRFTKGGRYQKWIGLETHRIDWEYDGIRPKTRVIEKYPYLKGNYGWVIKYESYHRKPGLTYSNVAQGALGVRLMDDAISGHSSHAIFPKSISRESLAAALNNRCTSFLLRAMTQSITFESGYVARVPVIDDISSLEPLGMLCVELKKSIVTKDILEESYCCEASCDPLSASDLKYANMAILHTIEGLIERLVARGYSLGPQDIALLINETGKPADWYPLIRGYDSWPPLPKLQTRIPEEVLDYFKGQDRQSLSTEKLMEFKRNLRILYEAGPGANVETLVESEEEETREGAYIPIPFETFLEELSLKLKTHPVSIYCLLKEGIKQEGWRCLPEERRITADYYTVTVLHLLGYRWPNQIEAGEPLPDWADPVGIIPLSEGTSELTLLDRIRERIIADSDGCDLTTVEREFAEIMGKPLEKWLMTEFFKYHMKQFKKRPIAWQLRSSPVVSSKHGRRRKGISEYIPGPAFSCIVCYHRLDDDLLPKIRSQYVRPLRRRYETELRTLENIERSTVDQTERRVTLENLIEELKEFDAKLEDVIVNGFDSSVLRKVVAEETLDKWTSDNGETPPPSTRDLFYNQEKAYNPDLNDGVRVNIAPLQKAGLLAAEVLSKKDVDRAIRDRAEWHADERRWCREEKLPQPGWWKTKGEDT